MLALPRAGVVMDDMQRSAFEDVRRSPLGMSPMLESRQDGRT